MAQFEENLKELIRHKMFNHPSRVSGVRVNPRPYVISIVGDGGSGKTFFADTLVNAFAEDQLLSGAHLKMDGSSLTYNHLRTQPGIIGNDTFVSPLDRVKEGALIIDEIYGSFQANSCMEEILRTAGENNYDVILTGYKDKQQAVLDCLNASVRSRMQAIVEFDMAELRKDVDLRRNRIDFTGAEDEPVDVRYVVGEAFKNAGITLPSHAHLLEQRASAAAERIRVAEEAFRNSIKQAVRRATQVLHDTTLTSVPRLSLPKRY